jgi:hypothetical protein
MIDNKQRWLEAAVCDGLKGLSAKFTDFAGIPDEGHKTIT